MLFSDPASIDDFITHWRQTAAQQVLVYLSNHAVVSPRCPFDCRC